MKKTFKKLIASVIAAIMILSAAPLSGIAQLDFFGIFAPKASALNTSGSCGENVTYSFDESTGTLTISGEGDISANAAQIISGNGLDISLVEKLVVKDGVENILSTGEIGNGTFSSFTNLCSVTLSGVRTVASFAFENCPITELDLGDIEIIRFGAFKSDTSYIDSLIIPASLDIAESWSLSLNINNLSFEEGFDGLSIVDENSYAPFADSELYNVVLPETLTTVTQWLFNQADISIMTIPGTVTKIEEYAFSGTDLSEIRYSGLRSQWNAITIGDNNDGLDYAYILYSSSEPVYLNDTVYYILDEASGTLTIDGAGATPDYGVRSDQNSPFTSETMWFTNVIIEEGITRIGDALFFDCNVENVQFADSVESIGKQAFDCCSSLEEIYIPKTVKTVEGGAFYECYYLEKITVDPESQYLCSVDGVLYNKDMTSLICYPARKTDKTEFVLPDSVETVEPFAFGANETLKKIVLSDGTSEVGAYAFAICALNEIDFGKSLTVLHTDLFVAGSVPGVLHIPETLTTIEDEVFGWCSNFEVYYAGSPSQWKAVAIGDNNDALLGVEIHYGKEDPIRLSNTVFFEFDEDTNTVRIFGEGAIPSYNPVGYSILQLLKQKYGNDVYVKNIVIDEGITEIEEDAFENFTEGYHEAHGEDAYLNVSFPNTLIIIGTAAFSNCAIRNITLPDGIEFISGDAFMNTEITEITIPGSIEEVWGAFDLCPKLETAIVEDGVKVLEATFCGCPALVDVTLPSSLRELYTQAFADCTSLRTITLPEGVTRIGDMAFSGDTSLEEIYLPESVEYIGRQSFKGCTSLKDVYYAGSSSEWSSINISLENEPLASADIHFGTIEASGALSDTVFWNYDETSQTLTIFGEGAIPDYNFNDKHIIDDVKEKFGEDVFIKNLVIDEGITEIGQNAFEEITDNYRWIEVCDDDVNIIDVYCDEYMNVSLPSTLKSIEDSAFDCCAIDSIVLPDGLVSVGECAFYGTYISELTIPDSVTNIEDGAFGKCNKLTTVIYGNGLSSTGHRAFEYCTALESVTLSANLKSVSARTFIGCTSLETLVVPEGVTLIDITAILDIKTIYLPESLKEFDCDTFSARPEFDDIYYAGSPSQWSEIDIDIDIENDGYLNSTIHFGKFDASGALSDTVGYTYDEATGVLTISGTGTIPTYASADDSPFSDRSFSEVVIGEGITEIGSFAFAGCDIGTVTLPKSIESIKDNAFADATAEKIIFCCDITELNEFDLDIGETGNEVIDDDKIQYLITDQVSDTITACFSTETATLTFSGTGAMPDYSPESPDTYGHYSRISEIKNVVFEEGITRIGNYTLVMCDGIESITLPDSLETIGEGAFVFAAELKTVSLGKNVSEIGDAAFGACYALEKFEVSDENTSFCSVDGVLYSKDRKELVLFPAGKDASEYTIADGTETIGTVAFLECDKLTSVTIPASVTVIEENAFDGTDNLKTVYYPGSQSEWEAITIEEGSTSFRNADIVCLADVAPFKSESGVELDIVGTGLYANGFNPGTTVEEVSAMAEDVWTVSVETADGSGRIGTGSVITMKNGDVEIDYIAVVYGDTTGDSWYDGQDAIVTNCFANGLLTSEQVSKAVYESADCNHDGTIDGADVALLEQAGVILASVDQNKSPEELMTDSAYVEYLNLIDQNPTEETTDVTPTDEPFDEEFNKSFIERLIDFIKAIIEIIKTVTVYFK